MALIFFGEVAKGATCLDLFCGFSMEGGPARVVGPAGQDGDDSPLLVADGYRGAEGLY